MFDLIVTLEGTASTDAERLEAIWELEHLKSAAAAAQARLTEAFDRSQRAAAAPLKPAPDVSRNISSQVALARQESPVRGQRHHGLALALVREMPHTLCALSEGTISEWAAMLIVRETSTLALEHRQQVDLELCGQLAGAGDRKIGDLARSIGYRLDPAAAMRRNKKAEADRRVTLRPAADGMSHLSALIPVPQGVGCLAALLKEAKALVLGGDPRTRNQIMADLVYQRLTGARTAATPDVEIQLVMNERTLIRGSHEPAHIPGYGAIPAFLARQIVGQAHRAWLRRLYTAPDTGELVAMDSRRRTFSGKRRDLLVLRDQTCRTPWCDAPIAHVDHVRPVWRGGRTTRDNGQGLCEACNYVKESPGWRVDLIAVPGHVLEITTPTGHTYQSRAPAQPGAHPPGSPEERLRRLRDDAA
jgi:Domain of unknown function (DUF222)/HNH endonuclease